MMYKGEFAPQSPHPFHHAPVLPPVGLGVLDADVGEALAHRPLRLVGRKDALD